MKAATAVIAAAALAFGASKAAAPIGRGVSGASASRALTATGLFAVVTSANANWFITCVGCAKEEDFANATKRIKILESNITTLTKHYEGKLDSLSQQYQDVFSRLTRLEDAEHDAGVLRLRPEGPRGRARAIADVIGNHTASKQLDLPKAEDGRVVIRDIFGVSKDNEILASSLLPLMQWLARDRRGKDEQAVDFANGSSHASCPTPTTKALHGIAATTSS